MIDELDARLIDLLAAEPRVGVLEASRRLGVARGTVQAGPDPLQSHGVTTGGGAVRRVTVIRSAHWRVPFLGPRTYTGFSRSKPAYFITCLTIIRYKVVALPGAGTPTVTWLVCGLTVAWLVCGA